MASGTRCENHREQNVDRHQGRTAHTAELAREFVGVSIVDRHGSFPHRATLNVGGAV